MRKWLRTGIILFCMLLSPLSAQSQDALRVGTGLYVPPFVISGLSGHIFGFDIDLMRALCKEIKRECQFYPMQFEYIYRELKDNKVDLAISAITITLERQEKVDFTLPYMVSMARYITNVGSRVTSLNNDQLKGKTFGVLKGSVFLRYVETNFPDNSVKVYDKTNKIIKALADRKIDISLVDAPTATFWVYHGGSQLLLVGAPFQLGWGFGIAVRKELPALVQLLNAAILRLQANGKYLEIYRKYF